jgi:flagellum-specific peptidoglycan hydrolase FlgJ
MTKVIKLCVLMIFMCSVVVSVLGETPFTEKDVKIDKQGQSGQKSSGAAKEDETGKAKKEDSRFPLEGTVEVSSSLRLREYPWGPVMGLFGGGTSVTVVGEEGDFYKVQVNGQTGYMHKNYVSVPGTPASGEEPYYPGDTRNGGYLPKDDPATKGNSGSTPGSSTTPSQAEAALANYKGGKLSPSEFSKLFGPVARESMKRTGVPASVTLAQAALETGWGGSSIGDAKNLFGIKGTGPAGSIRVSTKEFINGRMVTVQDNFRKYHTWAQSIEDHGKLLQNSRYSPAMKYKNNPDQFAREIHKAGYATDPNYASKLISIMKANNFYQWDK